MASSIYSPRTFTPQAYQPIQPAQKSLDEEIQVARDYARFVSETSGVTSEAAAVAWDIVEELMAAKADRRRHEAATSAFEQYCDANPDAAEARMYDV